MQFCDLPFHVIIRREQFSMDKLKVFLSWVSSVQISWHFFLGMLSLIKTQVPYTDLSLPSLNLLIPRSPFVKNYEQKD